MLDLEIGKKKLGAPRGKIVNHAKGKVNETISFDNRKDLLDSLEPYRVVLCSSPSGDKTKTPPPSDYVAIYAMPERDDYLMVDEPYNGNERSRLVYLPESVLNDFLLPGEKMDGEFWKSIARYYIDMGDKEFINEDRTSVLNHSNPEHYLNTVKELIARCIGKGHNQELSSAVTRRIEFVWKKLFKGEKAPDVEQFVEDMIENGNVTLSELDEMKTFIKSNKQSDKHIKDVNVNEHTEEEL